MDNDKLNLPPTGLAFVGDAVYTLFIRRRIATRTDHTTGTLHTIASRYVSAKAQAKVFDGLVLSGTFTEEEADVARRAKNAHLHSRAKGATPEDYHKATALEAVIGYLDIKGDDQRLEYLLELCYKLSDS